VVIISAKWEIIKAEAQKIEKKWNFSASPSFESLVFLCRLPNYE